MKQKLEKWESWLKVIYQEVVHLAASRKIYMEVVKIIRAAHRPAVRAISEELTHGHFIEKLKKRSSTVARMGCKALRELSTSDCIWATLQKAATKIVSPNKNVSDPTISSWVTLYKE